MSFQNIWVKYSIAWSRLAGLNVLHQMSALMRLGLHAYQISFFFSAVLSAFYFAMPRQVAHLSRQWTACTRSIRHCFLRFLQLVQSAGFSRRKGDWRWKTGEGFLIALTFQPSPSIDFFFMNCFFLRLVPSPIRRRRQLDSLVPKTFRLQSGECGITPWVGVWETLPDSNLGFLGLSISNNLGS